ncbi:LacI family DNA-binding transcriptional regulator [Ornithinimicrobium cryptoxanthini]|uniref:LacI family transcriptional regulator n=1 Tax=Ornithinimicrobium cryptoxanthini TaxID=2934161 RepID=A0ABY4YJD9_9MICO|nr:LacI family DNA-binding transcriptional regulator [Ornithinimicrobium cryptoxanthini]USQ76884.1 LacI family transcriptional regulator [Ornithinimicrobium cryptoxanthini]
MSRLADLAQHAGVSEATVSRVLNDRPGVAAGTRQAVLTALDVLGYERPSKLRRSSAGLVGLVVPELTNPIFPAFAQAVETHLAAANYTPVLCTQVPGGIHEDDYVPMLLDRGVASIIFISGLHADSKAGVERYTTLRERGLPITMINGYREGVEATFISSDDVAGMHLAVRHLRELGHTRIGLATGPSRYVPVQRKIAGYAEAMDELLPGREHFTETTLFTVEGGVAAGRKLLEQGVTAVVCGSDLMALGVIRAVRMAGLRVPEDVSVIGSDDSQLVGFTDPPLTTVRQDVESMSEAAVTAILEEIHGEEVVHREYLFAPELILRRSTGAAPGRR